MLKFRYANKSEIPSGLEGYYEERDGAWFLKVEGAVPREKLDEFRDKNVALLKELKEVKEKFEGVDPEEAKKLAEIKQELEDRKLKEKDMDKILDQRVDAIRKEYQDKLTAAQGTITQRDQELSRLRISEAAVAEALKLGLRPEAQEDLVNRISASFKLVDGKVVAYEPGTDKPRYNGQGDPFSIRDAVKELATEKGKHLFKESEGSGSGQGNKGGEGGAFNGANPFKKETLNMTRQAEIYRANPKEAARLAAEAGVTLPAIG